MIQRLEYWFWTTTLSAEMKDLPWYPIVLRRILQNNEDPKVSVYEKWRSTEREREKNISTLVIYDGT